MSVLLHGIAYLLAVVGGLVALFVATPIPAIYGIEPSLFPPKGLMIALPYALVASVIPYCIALAVLRVGGWRRQGVRILAGSSVTCASIALLTWSFGAGSLSSLLLSERVIIGILLCGAIAGYIYDQIIRMGRARRGGKGR